MLVSLIVECVASNLLFVESPAGVGWSYSNRSSDYNTGDNSTGKLLKKVPCFSQEYSVCFLTCSVFETANDMLVFLLRWFDKFPELKSRELFLTGESYAGVFSTISLRNGYETLNKLLIDWNVGFFKTSLSS